MKPTPTSPAASMAARNALAPDATDVADLLAKARNALNRANAPQEAAMLYEAAVRQQPENLEARLGAGRACLAIDRWHVAECHFRAALALTPHHPDAIIGISHALRLAHGLPAALAFLADAAPGAILNFRHEPQQMIEQAEALSDHLTDGLEDALPNLVMAIEPAVIDTATELAAGGQADVALQFYNMLVELGCEKPAAWRARGDMLLALGHSAEASDSYFGAMEVATRPDQRIAIAQGAATKLMLAGRPLSAIEFFNEVIQETHGLADQAAARIEAEFNAGICCYMLGHLDGALLYFNGALNLDPCHPHALMMSGLIEGPNDPASAADKLMSAGLIFMVKAKYSQAHMALAVGHQYAPDREDIHVLLGAATLELGRLEEALNHLEPYALHPNWGTIAAHFMGSCFLALGRINDAKFCFMQSLDCPKIGDKSARFLGRIYSGNATQGTFSKEEAQSRLEIALACWQHILRSLPHDEEAKLGAAGALHGLKKPARALRGAAEVLRANPDSMEALKLAARIQLDTSTLSASILDRVLTQWNACEDLGIEVMIRLARDALDNRKDSVPPATKVQRRTL